MPHMISFGHQDFKSIFEKEVVTFLVSKGVLSVDSTTQLQIIYEGDSQERLRKMGVTIRGHIMYTTEGGIAHTINLNEGTPTKYVKFSPRGINGVLMVGENVRGKKQYFIIEDGYLMEQH